ncbi:MAG: integrase [Gammaproteobacteria bacterium RIFCSPHIGHO2_12_FULL_40_19]|nr:MAG: integrase [Gammaproteobacteria bacterium RIFCSPHIGHO2_12_FULL_40_19]
MKTANFSVLLQTFFTDYLISQRQASKHTIASYRDTFCLFLKFLQKHLKKDPSTIKIENITVDVIKEFLMDLEKNRNSSVRSRNQRLAAIHSCFRYATFIYPELSNLIQKILLIPHKKHDYPVVQFLTSNEIDALLATPDRTTWLGRRNYALILLAIRTGLRVSEIINLHWNDITLGPVSHVHCVGKGRKERITPITKITASILKSWLDENESGNENLVFTNARRGKLSRDGFRYILKKHIKQASDSCVTLKRKRISPHSLRHTAAMQLLEAGVDTMIIAIWLGHESIESTQIYIKADLKMKENALNKTKDPKIKSLRYKPNDSLMKFLKSL